MNDKLKDETKAVQNMLDVTVKTKDLKMTDYANLPVLSIRQPWAWLIVNGYKDIENRNWMTKVRGKFLVHAALKWDKGINAAYVKKNFGIELPAHLPVGGIVGMAEIAACVNKSTSPWFFGRFGFVLQNAKPLPFYPCKGKLGFFRIK